MRFEVKFTTHFKKDLKLAKKQGKDIYKLFEVIEKLANGEPLEEKNTAIMISAATIRAAENAT